MSLGNGTGPGGQGPGTGKVMGMGRGDGIGRMGGNKPGAGPAGNCLCPPIAVRRFPIRRVSPVII
jgi:hypothetical protein